MENNHEKIQEERKQRKKQLKEEKLEKYMAKLKLRQSKSTDECKTKKEIKKIERNPNAYDSTTIERKWMMHWKENKVFRVSDEKTEKPVFSMIMPPPNITGNLHIGHAMMIAIEDAIVRYKRNRGYEVLYLPGLDHAGIATQSVVLKNIAREKKGKEVTREYFMDEAHKWSEKYGQRILEQFDRLGASPDNSKQVFTLDASVSKSVNFAFVKLHEKGLIYRDNRIVNWCSKLRTTLSDLEVEYREIKGGTEIKVDGKQYQMGYMYYFKYYLIMEKDKEMISEKIKECSRSEIEEKLYKELPYVIVGTTRPETIFGDTGICINPNDTRFDSLEKIFSTNKIAEYPEEKLRGKKVSCLEKIESERSNKYRMKKIFKDKEGKNEETGLMGINPLTYDLVKVVYDEAADLSLGTGVLKITPAHDFTDFTLGKKHKLPFITVMDENNRIDFPSSKYHGLSRYEVRERLEKEEKSFVRKEIHDMILPFCSRSNDIVEPRVKEQWWVKCDQMAQRAIKAVRENEIQLYPEDAKSKWYYWLENIHDWCISRQLWWGHRIPAWNYIDRSSGTDERKWIIAVDEREARKKAEMAGVDPDDLVQDCDVLDTWFSSGIWPLSTLGWGEKPPLHSALFDKFFPTSLLETGSDILFFWVSRMVMLSYELIDSKPFHQILLHGLVRDAHGRKMSKSLGNVIDPLFVIDGISLDGLINNISINVCSEEKKRAEESIRLDYPSGIPKCGADALRFTLLSYASKSKDINLDVMRVVGYSKFCNKLWNAFQFVKNSFVNIQNFTVSVQSFNKPQHLWILSLLDQCILNVSEAFDCYNFLAATQAVHTFFLYSFCDIFIEFCKDGTDDDLSVLCYVFVQIIRLLNPMMPFITEEIHYSLTSKIVDGFPAVLNIKDDGCFAEIVVLAKKINAGAFVVVVDPFVFQSIKKILKKSHLDRLSKQDSGVSECDWLIVDKEVKYKILTNNKC